MDRFEACTCAPQIVNEFLERHGSEEGGDYFLGGTYSAAETITTPFVRRMLVALPALRDFDVAAIVQKEGLHRLDRWFKVWPPFTWPARASPIRYALGHYKL